MQRAMQALRESFCRVVPDPQFVDVGVSRVDRDWRIVLARPLLGARLGDWQAEGAKLLEQINAARAPGPPVNVAASLRRQRTAGLERHLAWHRREPQPRRQR